MKRKHSPSAGLSPELFEKTAKELKLGYINLTDGFFQQAKMNFMLALELDKNCADAFWGLMLVESKIQNEDDLISEPMKYKKVQFMKECQKALECADETVKKQYENMLERIIKINEGDKY